MRARNVVAGSLSRRHQFWVPSEPWLRDWWTRYCPVASLGRLFATSFNYRLSPFPSHQTHGSREGCFLQSWDRLQAYALPMFSLVWQVLHSLGSCKEKLPSLSL